MIDSLILIGINFILSLIILCVLFCTFWPSFLKCLQKGIIVTREFIKINEGFFSILFILLFALEQVVLIGLTTYFREEAGLLRLIISIFALVVITTASLQKFILETKRRYENETKRSIKKSNAIIESYKETIMNLMKKIERDKLKEK